MPLEDGIPEEKDPSHHITDSIYPEEFQISLIGQRLLPTLSSRTVHYFPDKLIISLYKEREEGSPGCRPCLYRN